MRITWFPHLIKGQLLILSSLLIAIVILLPAITITPTLAQSESTSFTSPAVVYAKASAISADCTGPSDTSGRPWYDSSFDDSQWVNLQLPDTNTIPSGQDRYYRLQYNVAFTSTTKILLSSDDGSWLYVNGQVVGHWGADCHGGARADNVLVDITAYIHPGNNVIAVHVSNGPGGSLFDLVTPPQIILPMDSQVTVEFVSTSLACTGNFGLAVPYEVPIYNDYLYYRGVTVPLTRTFAVGEELIFFIKPGNFCQGPTYLSNDPSRARISRLDNFTWRINWEDWTDADFNDLVVEVRLTFSVQPFLELPFAYSRSFVRTVSDTDKGGNISSYFDHKYPTYGAAPNSGYTGTVSFHGFDSLSENPGFRLAYNGHDGIDFAGLKQNAQVLAAADGTVAKLVSVTAGDCLGNHAVISHSNNFTTTYGHLADFSPSISEGQVVARGTSLGTVGNTGCSTGAHLHFQITNAAGIIIDPFGWMPFPDSTYGRNGRGDPWRDYQKNLPQSKDATSLYLWIHTLDRRVLNNPNGPTIITSASEEITATLPVQAYNGPYRIELWDGLDSPLIADAFAIPLSTFELYAYNRDEQPIQSLLKSVQLEFKLDAVVQSAVQTVNPDYRIYRWDATTNKWIALDTTYDIQSGIIGAISNNLGRFAVTELRYAIFLPVIVRN